MPYVDLEVVAVNPDDIRPVEGVLADLRRGLERLRETLVVLEADEDGSLTELDAVLRLKRGCRR